MRNLRSWRLFPSLVVLTLIVATILGVANWLRMSRVQAMDVDGHSATSSSDRQAPMERPERSTALFVGDDFAAWGQALYTYPYMVCDAFMLNCNVDAQVGTGFLNSGQDFSIGNSPAIDRIAKDREMYDANVIIVDAGRNDLPVGADVFGEALGQYLRSVREAWPQAKIVVIVPWLLSTEQEPDYAEIASVVCQQTAMVDGVCIDPLAEGWLNGVDVSTLQMHDNVHPNQAGHTMIGKALSESLERHGVLAQGATT
jgi:lysophospholipase L1-like esterase